jgi:hypothetical protein
MRVHHATEHLRFADRLTASGRRGLIDLVRAGWWEIVFRSHMFLEVS